VLPTYHRREKLLRCLKSVEEARARLDCHSYVYIYYSDKADFQTDSNILRENKGVFTRLLDFPYEASKLWNYHLKNMNADMMVYINDDVELHPECLFRVKTAMNVWFPDTDGVVSIIQENIPENQACKTAFGAVGNKFADRFPERKVFCESYKRLYLDTELYEYASKHKKLFYKNDKEIAPLLTHYHPAFFKNEMDETHTDVRKHLNADKIMYNRRKAKNLIWGDSFELINSKN